MLDEKLSLKQMIEFKPSDEDMLSLDLDIIVYLKISLISLDSKDNYDFIKYFFTDEDLHVYFKQANHTIFYDFDGRHTNQEKFITIFEMYSLYNYDNVSTYLQEILTNYTHEADVIIDLYTHDNKEYRLSNLDGIVKLEEIINNKA